MPQGEAMKTLMKLCVFDSALTECQANDLWMEYRRRVGALPPRNCTLPASAKMSLGEKLKATKLMKEVRRKRGTNVRRVLKIDPMSLVIHQYQIILDRAEAYGAAMTNESEKARICLGFGLEGQIATVRSEPGVIIIELPHAEFIYKGHANGRVELEELARFIAVTNLDDRMMLWGGYHRTYGVANQASPDAPERVLLVTLTEGDADLFLGPDSRRPEVRDLVLGERPPIFADFFNDELCMSVNLRKQRPEWHVQTDGSGAELHWVDE
jgi:hypothetical protein